MVLLCSDRTFNYLNDTNYVLITVLNAGPDLEKFKFFLVDIQKIFGTGFDEIIISKLAQDWVKEPSL